MYLLETGLLAKPCADLSFDSEHIAKGLNTPPMARFGAFQRLTKPLTITSPCVGKQKNVGDNSVSRPFHEQEPNKLNESKGQGWFSCR